jgi:F-type H+-transporting ATPase subunit delta
MNGPEGNPMQSSTISRNYAETLLTLAGKANDTTGWGTMFAQLAAAMQTDKTLRMFLHSPRVSVATKSDVLSKALGDRVPAVFLRYLQHVVMNRRESMIPEISAEYNSMLDKADGRAFARVTLARAASQSEQDAIAAQLSTNLGKQVVPVIVVDPSILGGIIVRMGDTVMDGSVRRKLALLRRRMIARPSYSDA